MKNTQNGVVISRATLNALAQIINSVAVVLERDTVAEYEARIGMSVHELLFNQAKLLLTYANET